MAGRTIKLPNGMHTRKAQAPRYKFGDRVGPYEVVEYLGHKIPDFTDGFVKMHCYTVECMVCGERRPMTGPMLDSHKKRSADRARKAKVAVESLGCQTCKGVKPV